MSLDKLDAVSKRKLLAGARCLLFPIQWEEPFGMVMIEAMACGTPVVALRGGAVPEVIVDGVTGVICDRPAELPAAIERAQTMDPAVCRRHVAAHFGVAEFGSGYERIYQQLAPAVMSTSVDTDGRATMQATQEDIEGAKEERCQSPSTVKSLKADLMRWARHARRSAPTSNSPVAARGSGRGWAFDSAATTLTV